MPTIKNELLAGIDGPIRRLTGGRLYTAYTLRSAEYVGTTDSLSARSIQRTLRKQGYDTLTLLEAAKRHPDTGEVHDFSARKLDPEHPRWQYHTHHFRVGTRTYEHYSHYEYAPDPVRLGEETTIEMINRLMEHYKPTRGDTYLQGVHDHTLKLLVGGEP